MCEEKMIPEPEEEITPSGVPEESSDMKKENENEPVNSSEDEADEDDT